MENLHLACELAFYKTCCKLFSEKLDKYNTAIEIVYQWKPKIHYERGDVVMWHDLKFVCIRKHKSGKEFNMKFWELESVRRIHI